MPSFEMRTLRQSWLCLVGLVLLGVFSLVAGSVLEVGARSSEFAGRALLNGRPLPYITRWFLALYVEGNLSLLTLCFLPTAAVSAYLWQLVRTTPDSAERHARFALAMSTAFISIAILLVLGASSFALPFLPIPISPIRVNDASWPPDPPLQTGIFWCFLAMLLLNAVLFVRMFFSFRRAKPVGDNV
jgi:hypothetical protein